MSFVETLRRARALLLAEDRVSLRALRREFELDDAALEDLVLELTEVQRVAAREGDLLFRIEPASGRATPGDYTPRHLAEEILSSRAAREGERKQVTALFVDVHRSMALSRQLDPEQWHGVLDRFFRIATDVVHRFGGTVNQYTGDGIMALFGAPIAEEDHAACGCAAALELQGELPSFARDLKREYDIDFAVRMGLNSGEVVVGKIGDDLRMDYTAQGHTVGLAQRMQVLAEPGQVLLTEDTANLASGFLELRDLGPVEIRGLEHEVRAFVAEGLRSAVYRFDVARRRGLSRFVGRERELARLEAAAERARRGHEEVIGIVAEPGIGKSRLCHEFLTRCEAQGVPVVRASCSPHARDASLTTIAAGLRSYFALRDDDDEVAVREKVERRLREAGTPAGQVGLVLDFLGVAGDHASFSAMDPAGRETLLVEILAGIQTRRAASELWVFLYEDMHWIDAASERVLDAIFRRTGSTPALRLQTFRPEYRPPWSDLPRYDSIALEPLEDEHADELLSELLGDAPGMRRLAARIRERTGGNPLFIEETVREIRESGRLAGPAGEHRLEEPLQALSTPARIRSVIQARIDRLAPDPKQVLQAASAIGLVFDLPLLARVSARSDAQLGALLGPLVEGHFLAPDADGDHRFLHPLIQEVAYGSQLRPTRVKLHRAIAEELERRIGARQDERAALLAMHWEEADEPLRAARRHHDACMWLAGRNPPSAAAHARRVRELAAGLEESSEATALAVSGCNELLRHSWHTGLDFEQVVETFDQGFPLAERMGDRPAQVRMLLGYARRAKHMGEITAWHRSVQRAVALSEEGIPAALEANLAGERVHVSLLAGRFQEALAIADEVVDRMRGDAAILRDPEAGEGLPQALWLRTDALWALGRTEESLAAVRGLVDLAHGFRVPTLQALALLGNAKIAALCGLADEAMQRASEGRQAATGLGAILYLVSTHHRLGSAHLVREEFADAARELAASLDLARAHRIYADNEVHVLSDLALARLHCGDLAQARETAEEAVVLAAERGAVFHGCFARLARAQVQARDGDLAGARQDLLDVLGVAARTGARSFDARARSQLDALTRREGAA